MALARDRTPHVVFVDSVTVKYGYKAGDTWVILQVPAPVVPLGHLLGSSIALDTSDKPGIAVSWWKSGVPDDSLWLSFFEYDGREWHRFDVDSSSGWAPWDFWKTQVQYDPGADLFHIVHRYGRYVTGRSGNWQAEWATVSVGNLVYDFAYQDRPHIACCCPYTPGDPLVYQWRWAGGWEEELVGDAYPPVVSIAVDREGRPHIAFVSGANHETLYYARRLFVGTEEMAPTLVHSKSRLLVHPNPAQSAFTLEFPSQFRTLAIITLCDAQGRQVLFLGKKKLPPGRYCQSFNLAGAIKPGVYFLLVETEQKQDVAKIVIR